MLRLHPPEAEFLRRLLEHAREVVLRSDQVRCRGILQRLDHAEEVKRALRAKGLPVAGVDDA